MPLPGSYQQGNCLLPSIQFDHGESYLREWRSPSCLYESPAGTVAWQIRRRCLETLPFKVPVRIFDMRTDLARGIDIAAEV